MVTPGRANQRSAGYTLPEVMLTVAITGILASLGGGLILQTTRFYLQGQARDALQKEARAVMYVITRELRQAQNASIVISRYSNAQPYYSMITFTKEQGTTMSFFQYGNLLEQQSGVHVQILSRDLRYLGFTFPQSDDMTIISVSMTLQQATYQGQSQILHMASEKVQVMN